MQPKPKQTTHSLRISYALPCDRCPNTKIVMMSNSINAPKKSRNIHRKKNWVCKP